MAQNENKTLMDVHQTYYKHMQWLGWVYRKVIIGRMIKNKV